MEVKKARYFLILVALGISYGGYTQEVDGSGIFATNCAACHTIGQGPLVGPDLKGVSDKYEKPWIARFIRESQTMVAEGDEKAVAVFNAFSMIPMPSTPLSDEQIDALLDHIAKVSKGEPKPEPIVVEKKVTTSAKTQERVRPKIPDDQRASTRKAMMTGFWIAFAAISLMGIGIWWATR